MRIRLVKRKDGRHRSTYHRNDGSETWQLSDDFFIRHDLSHYAIEKTLGFKTAFYGMVNGGIEPADFLDRQKREAMKLTPEAFSAESMANLFLMDFFQGKVADFNGLQKETMRTSFPQSEFFELTNEEVENIRTLLQELLNRWQQLPPNGVIDLEIAV